MKDGDIMIMKEILVDQMLINIGEDWKIIEFCFCFISYKIKDLVIVDKVVIIIKESGMLLLKVWIR